MPVSPSLFSMTPHAPDGLSEWPTRRLAVIVPFVCSLGALPFRVNTEQCDPLLCEKLRLKVEFLRKTFQQLVYQACFSLGAQSKP